MGSLMRSHDWSRTALGPVKHWPQSLRIAVRILLGSGYPMLICWGPHYTMLYNDAYRPVLGPRKHPGALGRSCQEVFSEAWDFIGPLFEKVMTKGQDASTLTDQLFLLERNGYLEETYFTFSYSPIPDDNDGVGGVFVTALETTDRVIEDRRRRMLRDLAARVAEARSEEEVCRIAAETASETPLFIPFLLLYRYDPEKRAARLVASTGTTEPDLCRETVDCRSGDVWPFSAVLAGGAPQIVEDLESRFKNVPISPWKTPTRTACVMPIRLRGRSEPAGFLVGGLNPRRAFDENYRQAFQLLSDQIAAGMAGARAYENERRRAEELARLDKAKTTFFSNVSHELRTPLTLMLGPIEETMARYGATLAPEGHEQLAVARRNALRLLKLVNTLLDFSRIEAGRVQAVYEPVDLARLTAEIASVFRSAIEKAGLRFTVSCEDPGEPVYVDREMWEKIVLNLLSNAFKYTFEGEIAAGLRRSGDMAEFWVRDTGIGIPENELGHIFERFHRIETTRARTYEGTGIGLSLVQELAHLHGGGVTVESRREQGSTFRVSIPMGRAHLPEERIGAKRAPASAALASESWAEEVLRWTPDESSADSEQPALSWVPPQPATPATARAAVLVADDNADMREYVCRLLRPEYEVTAVSNGIAAMEAARKVRPALILTDIMMPGLDGFGVLQAIRSDPALRSTPVILLSARAGEESRLEGLQAGSDDYLVKPFTARELLARVATHIRMANLRLEAAEREARLHAEAETERRRFREILEYSPAAVGLLSGPDHRWSFVNDFYVRVTGRRGAEDFLGKTVMESLPELEGQGFVELLDEVYRTGEPYVGREVKVRLRRRGPDRPMEDAYFNFVYQPMRAASGEMQGILVHAVDVTDQVVARIAIEATQEKLQTALIASQRFAAIVESSEDAIVSKDLHGIVSSWNPAAEQIFGYTAEEMVGRSILQIIPPELHGDEQRILDTIGAGRRIEHFETVRVRKDGRRIDVSLTISPVRNEAGVIVGAAKIARDITKRKQTEQALRMSERLASVGRLAASIAHEINNPLEGLTNLVYLAKQNTAEPNTRDLLRSAEEELARVSLLTRQTLGFYRERATARTFTVSSLLTPLIAAYMSRIRNKAIVIQPEIRQDPEICGIAGEIRQVLANLLSNSIDAVPPGGRIRIRISSGRAWSGPHRSGVRLTIADSGSGIPAETRKRIYQPFFTTKKETGTGLGLWVCQGIVEKHGGRISLLSSTTPGRSGTAFSIFLPADGVVAAAA
ncbi:MAG TPA: ATP-binding protein [Acidobacteriaceae bacterium]|nr:ATP-binding protein [Acidobacteriaceae bacterium]